MPTTDDFLSALIASGQKLKKKRGRPKKKIEDLKTKGVMSTERIIRRINPGAYEDKAVVASYLKRYCTNCGESEISSIPRIFLLQQNKRVSSTRIYKRILSGEELHSYLTRLPLKTVLYPNASPGCKYCLQEQDAHAKSKEKQCPIGSQNRSRLNGEATTVPPGVIPAIPNGNALQTWFYQPLYNLVNQPGFTRGRKIRLNLSPPILHGDPM